MSAVTELQSLMNSGSIPPTPAMSLGYNRVIPSISKSAFTSLGSLGGPSQPAPAASAGYNFLSFYDDFTTLGTIDVTDSKATGFNWYANSAWPLANAGGVPTYPTALPADFTISSSVLTFTDTAAAGVHMWDACPTGNGSTYTGKVFGNGFYWESRFYFDASLAAPSALGWPAWWALPVEMLVGTDVRYIEPDFFEAFPTGSGTNWNPLMSLHDVISNPGPNNTNTNNQPSFLADWTQFHTCGLLWIPMAKNGGTGLVQRYFDGTHLVPQDVSYTATGPASPGASPSNPNGTFSVWDSENLVLIMSPGPNWPISVDYVQVWQ